METNYNMMCRFNDLRFKSEEDLEKILQDDLQEIIDLRETINIYETKKERFDILQKEKSEIIYLLNKKRCEKDVQQD